MKRHIASDQHGAVAIEFALIGLLLFQIAFGAIELMRLSNTWSGLRWVCDTAARYATANVSGGATGVSDYAVTQAEGVGLTGARIGVKVGVGDCSAPTTWTTASLFGISPAVAQTFATTTMLSIQATYEFRVAAGIVPLPPVTLTAQSCIIFQ